MFLVVVNNYIDCFMHLNTNNPMVAVVWGIAALNGPCRSGEAFVYDRV